MASGNKQFKLRENLRLWQQGGVHRACTFGGAWSNHLHAFAVHTRLAGIESVGVVRGDEPIDNPLLQSATSHGMRLHFISRAQYRLRDDPVFCQQLSEQLGCDAWLAEGGFGHLAIDGCRSLAEAVLRDTKTAGASQVMIALPVGTGATLTGVAIACANDTTNAIAPAVTGFQVVKDQTVGTRIRQWLSEGVIANTDCWSLCDACTVPRYGKVDADLAGFILDFFEDTGICLDPLYTGKVMRHITSPGFTESLPTDTHLVFLHTGGLLGSLGFKHRFEQTGRMDGTYRYFNRITQLTRDTRCNANGEG